MTGFTPPGVAGTPGVTQRLIVRYAKRGRMRFASHRDVARAVERGVRRAGLPIAYSAGFTPHPKISYASAAPTGTASEAEYLELSLTVRCAASEVCQRLGAALPDGMDVIEVTEAAPTVAALPLEASHWRVVLPGVSPDEAARACLKFLGCQTLEVERLTSKGTRRVDARAAVVSMAVVAAADRRSLDALAAAPGSPGVAVPPAPGRAVLAAGAAGTRNATLEMIVRHVIPAVRPDEILTALRRVADLAPLSPPLVTRLAQGALDEVTMAAGWPAASGAPARGGRPGGSPPQPGVLRGRAGDGGGRSAPGEEVKTTRHDRDRTTPATGTRPAGACNQLLRGADGPQRAAAPGSLTGDCPDARERAARQRTQQ